LSPKGSSRFRLFGLTVASDYCFNSYLSPTAAPPDLTLTVHPSSIPLETIARQLSLPALNERLPIKKNVLVVCHSSNGALILAGQQAVFQLKANAIAIYPLSPLPPEMVEIYFLGAIMAMWLEWWQIIALHAAAAIVNNRAVAFLSSNSGGKSSLVASLMQAGFPLLTDDILPVENKNGVFVGRPGYPQMRMWPEQAQHFLGYYETLEIVHPAYSKRRVPIAAGGFGSFCNEAQPLAYLYIPEQRDPAAHGTSVAITAVPPAQAVIDLVRYSFAPRLVHAAGLQPQRLDFFAELVRQIPIRRLIYPTGYEHLPRVRDAILDDLACL
jgi:hypothetical protein